MKRTHAALGAVLTTLLLSAPALAAGTIDFESVPGGGPSDGLAIGQQFKTDYGIEFGLDTDNDGLPNPGATPVLAKTGDPGTAFLYDTGGVGDSCAPGQDCGSYFLTDDGVISGPPSPLIVTYAIGVSAAYGEILDIDGQEAWVVEARDKDRNVIESIQLQANSAGTGDGIATPWAFSHMTEDIYSIRIAWNGGATGGVGLAFDNFSPTRGYKGPDPDGGPGDSGADAPNDVSVVDASGGAAGAAGNAGQAGSGGASAGTAGAGGAAGGAGPEAGVEAGAGSAGKAGATAQFANNSGDDGGCGCRVQERGSTSIFAGMALIAAVLVALRRRRG